MSLVSSRTGTKPFVILQPGTHPARTHLFHGVYPSRSPDLPPLLRGIAGSSGSVSFDFETTGVGVRDRPVMIGLGWAGGSVCIDLRDLPPEGIGEYLDGILSPLESRLVAHNLYFDLFYLSTTTRREWKTRACTYGLLRQLACEGFEGQRWGLKPATVDLLGWEERHDADLHAWLVEEGHTTKSGRPDLSKMHLAPADILGKYCALDAEATYLLYYHILSPALVRFPQAEVYHTTTFLPLVRALVEQRYLGMKLDIPKLRQHRENLTLGIETCRDLLHTYPEVAAFMSDRYQLAITAWEGAEPQQFTVPKVPREPARLRKDGTVSKNWTRWQELSRSGKWEPRIRKQWTDWVRKGEELEAAGPTSTTELVSNHHHRRALLYSWMGVEPRVFTDAGLPATSEDALRGAGEVGALLIKIDLLRKELEYVEAYLELADSEGVLRPGFSVPGTLTGRLAGSSPNLHQIPKTRGTLSCFVPRTGYVFVDCDHVALEQVVLAELSQDPALLSLYGPGAPKNDVYLFVGAQIPALAKPILEAGYDPRNPTPEGIKRAKEQAKASRGVAKVVVLASSYGAGARKIQETLALQAGVSLPLPEVQEILAGYWRIFAGVRTYERALQEEWRERRGWVLGPLGYPIGVAEAFTKDIVNRVVQRTGHDLHMRYVKHLRDILQERPHLDVSGVVWDWHDQTILEVREDQAEEVRALMEGETYSRLHSDVGGSIPLRGEATICRDFVDVKKPER